MSQGQQHQEHLNLVLTFCVYLKVEKLVATVGGEMGANAMSTGGPLITDEN